MSETRYHLLLVDDDPLQLSLAQAAAEMSGIYGIVNTAKDGADALADLSKLLKNKSGLPDIILSDLKMPLVDGITLTRKIKSQPALRAVPVVIYTSSDEPRDREEALAVGCVQFLSKASNFEDLQRTIESLPRVCGIAHPKAWCGPSSLFQGRLGFEHGGWGNSKNL